MKHQVFLLVVLLLTLWQSSDACYPTSTQWGNGPNGMPRSQWFCQSFHGFLGFSYPVEDNNCDDYSYEGFKNDFNRHKTQYNATFVRLYLPVCYQTSFWVKMVKAARDTSMALIPMVFWDWQENDPVMRQAEDALMGVFTDSEVGSIAPYIIHSVAFGDELGEEGNYWVNDLADFGRRLNQYGVLLSISDDWDRQFWQNGNGGLTQIGQQVNSMSNLTQAHIQPYYHPWQVTSAYDMWPYFQAQMQGLVNNNKRPILVSQTMWAYNPDGHGRGGNDQYDNMENYKVYWNTMNSKCQVFKDMQIGWFFHTWYGEPGFDLINDQGNAVFDWHPTFC